MSANPKRKWYEFKKHKPFDRQVEKICGKDVRRVWFLLERVEIVHGNWKSMGEEPFVHSDTFTKWYDGWGEVELRNAMGHDDYRVLAWTPSLEKVPKPPKKGKML